MMSLAYNYFMFSFELCTVFCIGLYYEMAPTFKVLNNGVIITGTFMCKWRVFLCFTNKHTDFSFGINTFKNYLQREFFSFYISVCGTLIKPA